MAFKWHMLFESYFFVPQKGVVRKNKFLKIL